MGYRQAAVLVSVSFFLGMLRAFNTPLPHASAPLAAANAGSPSGVLFICLNVDYRILFTPLTDSVVRDGIEFYTTFYNSPPAIKASTWQIPLSCTSALLHAVMAVGLLGLVGKLHKWDDSAMFFDGSSLAAYIFGLAIYLTVGIPACRTVVDPVPDVDSQDDQVEALRILSAGNTIIIVLLGGILALQAQQWARRIEEKMLKEAGEQHAQKPATTVDSSKESKKDK
ncbi:hypothetical protein BN946_scf184671.g8 [Trametes cinnabarina]|uniref:Shr3 amino acid permease chaperone n=1 Tax=Pycnoporus cinnabarinus TaxID=5643 RepID=A0A060SJV0_PYCCI|nr:hypothetical protein BN946_scf184671.g8 [Trametes cinnabarina]